MSKPHSSPDPYGIPIPYPWSQIPFQHLPQLSKENYMWILVSEEDGSLPKVVLRVPVPGRYGRGVWGQVQPWQRVRGAAAGWAMAATDR